MLFALGVTAFFLLHEFPQIKLLSSFYDDYESSLLVVLSSYAASFEFRPSSARLSPNLSQKRGRLILSQGFVQVCWLFIVGSLTLIDF